MRRTTLNETRVGTRWVDIRWVEIRYRARGAVEACLLHGAAAASSARRRAEAGSRGSRLQDKRQSKTSGRRGALVFRLRSMMSREGRIV